MFKTLKLLSFSLAVVIATVSAQADTVKWNGPNHTLTLGLSETDIAHVEMPEEVINVTVEDPDYVDILVVEGYGNRAFRMRSMLPKMATRVFMTGKSGRTYIVVLTTDVPYRSFVQVVDAAAVEDLARNISKKFDATDLIRGMALDQELPGILRETYMIPGWFKGAGLTFDLTEIWQSSKLTGLVVQVQNEYDYPNEVNLPAITIPKTGEWGVLRKASMENMRLAPKGQPNDKGVMYLVFGR